MFTNDNIVFFDEDSGNVTFSSYKIVLLNVDLNINLDNVNSDEDDPETIIMSNLWLGAINLNNAKHLKRNKQRINACSMASYKMVGLVHVRK